MKLLPLRWLLLAPLLLVAVGLGVGVWHVWFTPYPCRETFEKVRKGMTREEVYATVGSPPDDAPGGGQVLPDWQSTLERGYELWKSEDAILGVQFSADGTVDEFFVSDEATYWTRVRYRLGV
jgi:hypothetical protein